MSGKLSGNIIYLLIIFPAIFIMPFVSPAAATGGTLHANMVTAQYLGIDTDFGRWPGGVVTYVYNPTGAPAQFSNSAATLLLIQQAMAEWSGVCGIKFQPQGSGLDTAANLDDMTDGVVVIAWRAIAAAGEAGPYWSVTNSARTDGEIDNIIDGMKP